MVGKWSMWTSSFIRPSFLLFLLPSLLPSTYPSILLPTIHISTYIHLPRHSFICNFHPSTHPSTIIYTLIHPPTHLPTHPSITQTHTGTGHLLWMRHHTQHTQITSLMERTIYQSKETCRQTTPPAAWVVSRDRQMQRE